MDIVYPRSEYRCHNQDHSSIYDVVISRPETRQTCPAFVQFISQNGNSEMSVMRRDDHQLAVRVTHRAAGIPAPENFELVESAIPECPAGGVLVRVMLCAVDPAMRGWLSAEANYMTVPDGAVMRAHGVGEIIASNSAKWQVGEQVFGWLGWQRFAAIQESDLLWRIDTKIAPAESWLSIFGLNGLTAWVGFLHLARPLVGQTVLVTTAAGGVGSVVGQLAKAHGLRAIGIAGGREKIRRAVAQFGYDKAIDYHAADTPLSPQIAAACPSGIDIFFDNTAGHLADSVFPHLNVGARIIQCGTAAISSWLPPPTGPRRERDMLVKRLNWQGLVAFDHASLFPKALQELQDLHKAGKLIAESDILDGLENAPGSIQRLYRGENQGRLSIRP
jgi:NADPH-dependent curcumin reductase CurA